MSIIQELKRRNVFRMGAVYIVAAWLLMQVAEVLISLANWPGWIGPTLLWLLAVGFPIALLLSWFYQITPEGISLEDEGAPSTTTTRVTDRRFDFIVISLLTAAVLLFAYDKWWPRDSTSTSIAVLAFEDLSADGDQEYFSDGISEELLNLLARVPNLRVISRTSAFSYKGKQIDVPTIAQQLSVSHILEGSVRKSGNEIRITVQLIEADTDTHLWSETYDRVLDDIFATQDEIASKVVQQLRISLFDEIPTLRRTDPEAYALLLQAHYFYRQGTKTALEKAVDLYNRTLAIDPESPEALAGLAGAYIRQADKGLTSIESGYTRARTAAERALALDRSFVPALRHLGWVSSNYDRDLQAAARYYEMALAADPANFYTISSAANLVISLGRLEESIALAEYASARDPVNPVDVKNLGLKYLHAGRLDEAVAAFRTTLDLSPGYIDAHFHVGVALMLSGELELALDAILNEADEGWRLIGSAMAYHALGEIAAADAALAELIQKYEHDAAYNIAYVLAYRGEADLAYSWLDKAVAFNDPGLDEIATEPLFARIRSDPRWIPFLQSINMSPEQLAAVEFDVGVPR